jgi:UDP-N-acetylglucosamine--N-acetylmuramyl-(pentapeptide) pyrophosphoryl-undecaprenol N-acetylglucosamine transferase
VPGITIHFVGSTTGLENGLIQATNVPLDSLETVQAGPLHGVNPLRISISLVRLLIGILQSLFLLRRIKPDVLFLTGGWVGVPVAVAAWVFRLPIVIFVPDIEPGLTLKVLGRFAKVITATTPDTQMFFPRKKVIATGYPLREDMLQATRAAGLKRFGLDERRLTLLVFGGSRGARSINRALLKIIHQLPSELQIIHVSGSLDWEEVRAAHQQLSPELQARYHVYEYLHDMGLAMAAADLVVSRGGASTLGEFPYFHLPAVLIPYPHAWRYQKVNAEWLVSRGAAIIVRDEVLETELAPAICRLVEDAEYRQSLQMAATALASERGAENIARVILEAA